MAEKTGYPHGMFSWVDLGTSDPEGAKSFYEGLFGWTSEDMPTGPDGVYVMFRKNGRDVAACYQNPPEHERSFWASYVTVDDVDKTTETARAAGARIMQEPFDVLDAGRMSVLADPTGAVFCLWQANENIGAQLVTEHGAFSWNELMTEDVEAAKEFYATVLGWTFETWDESSGYWVAKVGDDPTAGLAATRAPEMPSYWGIYFGSDDVDAAASYVTEHGGSVVMEPEDFPGVGRIAAVSDPQGAAFGLVRAAPSG